MIENPEENIGSDEMRISNFSQIIAIVFVTAVMVLLFIKIIFF